MTALLLKNPIDLPAQLEKGVVAIGNFDGVHQGHRAVAQAAFHLAQSLPGGPHPVLALTFDPHPRQFFQPARPHFRLLTPDLQAEALHQAGFEAVITLSFDTAFAQKSAESFVREVLVGQLKVAGVVVGRDFHFGHQRAGTPDFLREAGQRHGFKVHFVDPVVSADGTVISSSAIRAALAAGDLSRAASFLGRDYAIRAMVVHGEKRGRELGYPTANLKLEPNNGLKHGIYACLVQMDGRSIPAVASFGRRPTFDNGAPLLEVHLFDFAGDLYGKTLDVAFRAYLRDELKFDNLDALINQMDADSAKARLILAQP